MRRVLLALILIFLATLLGAGWYAYDRGFTRKWRNAVTDEFHKRGVEISLRKLSLDPMRGIVAQQVRLLDVHDRKRVVAEVDEVILQVNYANLVRGRTFLDALDLRDANLTLPVDPTNPHSPHLEVSRLNARLFLPPQQIYLAHADAMLFGIHISAQGRLINPQDSPRAPEDSQQSTELIARAIEELKALRFESAPPVLSVTFSGDLSAPETVLVEAALWGEGIRRGSYRVKSLYVAGCFRDGTFDLKRCKAADDLGALDAVGSYQQAARTFDFRLHSRADIHGLVRSVRLLPELDDFSFPTAPDLALTIEGAFGDTPRMQAIGHLAARKFSFRKVAFEDLESDFSWDGERWSVRDFQLTHRTGKLTGDAIQVPGDFRARLESTINPKSLQPLYSGELARAMAQFDFREAPTLALEIRGTEPSPAVCTATGDVRIGSASYRGAACEGLKADLHWAGSRLSLAPFRLRRSEGSAAGGIVFDFKRDEVKLDHIRATVNPPEVARWIDADLVKNVSPYRFKRAPNLVIDGVVHTSGGKTTKLTVDVDAPGGVDYTFMQRDLSFPQISAKLEFLWDRMKIHSLSASLFGGRMTGTADISLPPAKPSHGVNMQLDNVDFASLTKLYFGYDDSKGRLNAHYDFTGRGDDARTMKGRGELLLTEGNVFAIPFLGPLSGVLNSLVPGMGYNVARIGKASFTVDAGVIETKDFVVEGRGFSMIGNGKLFYLDDRMNFNMRINAQGLPGVLLFPVSKLLEYTSTDKLSKPNWRPKVVPKL